MARKLGSKDKRKRKLKLAVAGTVLGGGALGAISGVYDAREQAAAIGKRLNQDYQRNLNKLIDQHGSKLKIPTNSLDRLRRAKYKKEDIAVKSLIRHTSISTALKTGAGLALGGVGGALLYKHFNNSKKKKKNNDGS